MTLRVFGDSHVGALLLGRQIALHRGETPDVAITGVNGYYLQTRFFEARNGAVAFTRADYREKFAMLAGRGEIVPEPGVTYGFCMGLHAQNVVREPCWRRIAPWRIARFCGQAAVSDALVAATAVAYARPVLDFYDALIGLKIPFFVISAPPLFRDAPCIVEGTNPEVAIRVDRAYRQAVTQELDYRGLKVVPPPAHAADADGFLKPAFRAPPPDPHHANAAYGKFLLDDVLAFSRRFAPQPVEDPPARAIVAGA